MSVYSEITGKTYLSEGRRRQAERRAGKPHPVLAGIPKSAEQRKKMSDASRGVPKSAKHVASMSVAQTRRWSAVYGDFEAVSWYLDRGKDVPDHREGSCKPRHMQDRDRRAAAIAKYYRLKGLSE